MMWSLVLFGATIYTCSILGFRLKNLKIFSLSLRWIVPLLLLVKAVMALTMGHLDIYRFIYFIKHFVGSPELNPWNLQDPLSDFPYPPVLLHLHAVVFFVKKSMAHVWVLLPDVLDYVLIRLPFLAVDILFSRFLLKRSTGSFILYVFSPLVLFHQVYSGQLDLIAMVPFLFGLLCLQEGKKVESFFFIAVSLALKPYAVLFLPFLVFVQPKRRDLLQVLGFLTLAFVLFKLTELPFSLSSSYQAKVGAGAKFVFIPKYLSFYFSILITMGLGFYFKWIRLPRERVLFGALFVVSLAVGVVDYHSAGWLLWPLGLYLLWEGREKFLPAAWVWIWNFLFVLRWTFIDHSPFFDSLDVFLEFYCNWFLKYGMGFFYRWIEVSHSKMAAEQVMRISVDVFETFTYLMLAQIGYRFYQENRKAT